MKSLQAPRFIDPPTARQDVQTDVRQDVRQDARQDVRWDVLVDAQLGAVSDADRQ